MEVAPSVQFVSPTLVCSPLEPTTLAANPVESPTLVCSPLEPTSLTPLPAHSPSWPSATPDLTSDEQETFSAAEVSSGSGEFASASENPIQSSSSHLSQEYKDDGGKTFSQCLIFFQGLSIGF